MGDIVEGHAAALSIATNLPSVHSLACNISNSASSRFNTANSHVSNLANPVNNSATGMLHVVHQRIEEPFFLL